MFWVSSKNGDMFGVTDTSDNVEEFFKEKELIKICLDDMLDIDGVDILSDKVCVVDKIKNTLMFFIKGDLEEAFSTMTMSGTWFTLSLKSEKLGSYSKLLNVRRTGANRYDYFWVEAGKICSNVEVKDILHIIKGMEENDGYIVTVAMADNIISEVV